MLPQPISHNISIPNPQYQQPPAAVVIQTVRKKVTVMGGATPPGTGDDIRLKLIFGDVLIEGMAACASAGPSGGGGTNLTVVQSSTSQYAAYIKCTITSVGLSAYGMIPPPGERLAVLISVLSGSRRSARSAAGILSPSVLFRGSPIPARPRRPGTRPARPPLGSGTVVTSEFSAHDFVNAQVFAGNIAHSEAMLTALRSHLKADTTAGNIEAVDGHPNPDPIVASESVIDMPTEDLHEEKLPGSTTTVAGSLAGVAKTTQFVGSAIPAAFSFLSADIWDTFATASGPAGFRLVWYYARAKKELRDDAILGSDDAIFLYYPPEPFDMWICVYLDPLEAILYTQDNALSIADVALQCFGQFVLDGELVFVK
jgi:hypothetical protein